MKKLLNTLYVTRQNAYLHQEGETIVIEQDHQLLLRLPIHTLQGIVTFGDVMISPFLMNLCAERGVCISMFSESGKFLARVEGPVSGNVLLRLAQMKAWENLKIKTSLARSFLLGKIYNAKNILARCIRDHGENAVLDNGIATQVAVLQSLKEEDGEVENMRGLEGVAASAYFQCFNELLVQQREEFQISARTRRPPKDPLNALLSYLYTLLAHDCRGALEAVGLDPQIGFLHEIRPGRPALALDLMEEFRSIIADRVALSLINLKQVSQKDFQRTESGAVSMTDDCRKIVLDAWQKKKHETVTHPFLDEKMEVGLLLHAQALLLARFLRGDLDAYPPYIQKG